MRLAAGSSQAGAKTPLHLRVSVVLNAAKIRQIRHRKGLAGEGRAAAFSAVSESWLKPQTKHSR